jgi:hypothetical protein
MIKQKHFIMKKYILVSFLFFGLFAQSQTKIIAHKSHSGSVKNFSKAYKNNLFDINRSNFGGPFIRPLIYLDTVIAVNDSTTILKTRHANFCSIDGTIDQRNDSSNYTYRSETVYNHPLFKQKNSIKSIKSNNESQYFYDYSNPVKDVVFIGFKEK